MSFITEGLKNLTTRIRWACFSHPTPSLSLLRQIKFSYYSVHITLSALFVCDKVLAR